MGASFLSRSYAIFTDFYGSNVATLLSPFIAAGAGEAVAASLTAAAVQLQPLLAAASGSDSKKQTETAPRTKSDGFLRWSKGQDEKSKAAEAAESGSLPALYQRLRTAVDAIEDLEGVNRGYLAGHAFGLFDETPASSPDPSMDRGTPPQLASSPPNQWKTVRDNQLTDWLEASGLKPDEGLLLRRHSSLGHGG